ncbi:MAG: DNA-processing protein DprA [Armatimonadota bacterium]
MDDLRLWIRLTKTGASARRLNTLLAHFGSPDAIFGTSAASLSTALRCSVSVAEKLLDPLYAATERDLELMERLNTKLVTRKDPAYPALLAQIPDPPPAIYVRGTLRPSDCKAVGIVGSRRASDYGRRIADKLAMELAQAGYTVVSGLARGIDTSVHQGALRAGGRTLACLGCGVDVVYPPENRRLAQSVSESGALVSEYPMMAPPDAWHFPSRNRIISGLSLGVVVLEAPAGSGALITAECAVDQNREVFAIPGNVDNFRNQGAHALLRDGAALVESVQDILDVLESRETQPRLDLGLEEPAAPAPPQLTPEESALLALLTEDPRPVDDLILESSMPAGQVNAGLLMLEMKGCARRLPGNAFVRLS